MVRLRQFAKLEYGNPRGFLNELRKFEYTIAATDTPLRLKTLRTNRLKREREMRDAALFCVGMSHNLGTEVLFAPVEAEDYDFIATWRTDGAQHFCAVQLKEVVPAHLNSTASIQDVIGKLSHYGDSTDVSVAIKFNQIGRFEPGQINPPNTLRIGGLWVFGAMTEDQSMWALWGDFMQTGPSTLGICYPYPIEQADL